MAAQLCEAQGKASLGSSVKTFFFPFAKEIAKLGEILFEVALELFQHLKEQEEYSQSFPRRLCNLELK